MSFDVAQAYIEMSHQQEQTRIIRASANLAILRASTIPFIVEYGDGLIRIRDKSYPAIDFKLGQNEWLVGNRKMLGDAQALIDFLKRRAMK